jgi:hypothetical protein
MIFLCPKVIILLTLPMASDPFATMQKNDSFLSHTQSLPDEILNLLICFNLECLMRFQIDDSDSFCCILMMILYVVAWNV